MSKPGLPTCCPSCGSTALAEDNFNGDCSCLECGTLVYENRFADNITFTETAGGAKNVVGRTVNWDDSLYMMSTNGFTGGASNNTNTSTTGMDMFTFGNAGVGGMNFGTDGSFQMGGGIVNATGLKQSREIAINKGKKAIDNFATKLKLSQAVVSQAYRIYILAVDRSFNRGRKTMLIAAACLYIVCRNQKCPVLLIDFADSCSFSVRDIGQTYIKLVSELKWGDLVEVPVIDPSLFMERFASRLELGNKTSLVASTAVRLVQQMGRDWLQQGRRPTGLCGAALLVASRWHGINRDAEDCSKVVRISEEVLRKRLMEMRSTTVSGMTKTQIEAIDYEKPPEQVTLNLPPIMQKRIRQQIIAGNVVQALEDAPSKKLALENKTTDSSLKIKRGLIKRTSESNLQALENQKSASSSTVQGKIQEGGSISSSSKLQTGGEIMEPSDSTGAEIMEPSLKRAKIEAKIVKEPKPQEAAFDTSSDSILQFVNDMSEIDLSKLRNSKVTNSGEDDGVSADIFDDLFLDKEVASKRKVDEAGKKDAGKKTSPSESNNSNKAMDRNEWALVSVEDSKTKEKNSTKNNLDDFFGGLNTSALSGSSNPGDPDFENAFNNAVLANAEIDKEDDESSLGDIEIDSDMEDCFVDEEEQAERGLIWNEIYKNELEDLHHKEQKRKQRRVKALEAKKAEMKRLGINNGELDNYSLDPSCMFKNPIGINSTIGGGGNSSGGGKNTTSSNNTEDLFGSENTLFGQLKEEKKPSKFDTDEFLNLFNVS